MPKKVRTKIGEIHRVDTVKTFGDQVKEVLGGAFVILVIIMIIGAVFG